MPSDSPAFVPPPYPHDRLGPIRATAAAVPGGILDASVGTPVDPMPAVALEALTAAAPAAHRVPGHHRQPRLPRGRGRMGRTPLRLSAHRRRRDRVHRHQGSGGVAAPDVVAARPVARHRALPGGGVPHLRDGRDRSPGCARYRCRSTTSGTSTSTASILPTPTARSCSGSTTRATRPARSRRLRAWSEPSNGRVPAGSSSPATSATPSSPTTPTARPPRRSPRSTQGPTACSWSTRSRSARTWPGCAPDSSPATARSSRTWARCASTAGS